MRKSLISVAIIAVSMLLNGCGANSSKLGTDLATAAVTGAAANGANGNSGLGSLASILTSGNTLTTVLSSLLGTKTTVNSLVGTWTYSQPKVVFESESVLAKIGSSVASSKIESSLNSQLKKIGFTTGKSTITFDANGNYTMALGSKTYTGTYTYNTSTSTMTMKGALGVTSEHRFFRKFCKQHPEQSVEQLQRLEVRLGYGEDAITYFLQQSDNNISPQQSFSFLLGIFMFYTTFNHNIYILSRLLRNYFRLFFQQHEGIIQW